MPDLVDPGSEPGLGEVAVGLALWPSGAEEVAGGACRPGDGPRDEAHQQVGLARVGETGVLEVEAPGFGISKEALDGPSLAVCVERLAGRLVGGDDEPLTARERFGGEAEAVASALSAGAEPAAEVLAPPAPVQAGLQREFVAILGCDAQVATQANGEGDVVFTQEIGPCMAPRLRGGRL